MRASAKLEPTDGALRIHHLPLELREQGQASDTDPLRAKLQAALESDTPAQSVIDVMRETPEGKDRWYLYRSDRLHDLIGDWLNENEITATDDPPWADSAD